MIEADPRIPVAILAAEGVSAWLASGGPAALVTDGPEAAPGFAATERFDPRPMHRFGCACCAGRSAAAVALDRLFQARARGRAPWFDRVAVMAGPAAQADIAAALEGDALTLARYRAA